MARFYLNLVGRWGLSLIFQIFQERVILTIPLMEIDIATHGISRMYIFNFN